MVQDVVTTLRVGHISFVLESYIGSRQHQDSSDTKPDVVMQLPPGVDYYTVESLLR
jgi:hypothetical protein